MKKEILIVASANPGKIREIKEILWNIPYEIKSLLDLPDRIEIEETGQTFEDNAVIKAKTVGEKTGFLTLGEDSGLEVDALGGKPGIYSARYASGTDKDRNEKLLKGLEGVPKEKRTARYKAVVAIYIPTAVIPSDRRESRDLPTSETGKIPRAAGIAFGDARPRSHYRDFGRDDNINVFTGVSEGFITEKPIGQNGFGYDPIFFNLDLGKTNGEATLEEKNKVSHRAKAMGKVREYLLSSKFKYQSSPPKADQPRAENQVQNPNV